MTDTSDSYTLYVSSVFEVRAISSILCSVEMFTKTEHCEVDLKLPLCLFSCYWPTGLWLIL